MARKHTASRALIALAVVVGALHLGAGVAGAATPAPTSTTVAPGTPPATPASVPTDAEIEAKRAKVAQARLDADAAAKAYVDANAELERLDQRIAVLEQRIPRLQARITELKELLANRAAVLYRGGGAPGLTVLGEIGSTGDLIAGARIARLADAAQESTDAQMDELDQNRQQLETDRDAMTAARQRQDAPAPGRPRNSRRSNDSNRATPRRHHRHGRDRQSARPCVQEAWISNSCLLGHP